MQKEKNEKKKSGKIQTESLAHLAPSHCSQKKVVSHSSLCTGQVLPSAAKMYTRQYFNLAPSCDPYMQQLYDLGMSVQPRI